MCLQVPRNVQLAVPDRGPITDPAVSAWSSLLKTFKAFLGANCLPMRNLIKKNIRGSPQEAEIALVLEH